MSLTSSPVVHGLPGWWRDLLFAQKLLLSFGVLLLLSIFIAGVTLFGLYRTKTAYAEALSQGVKLRILSDRVKVDLLEARRAEKNFLLRWQSEGFDTAYANYVTTHGVRLDDMLSAVEDMQPLGDIVVSAGLETQQQFDADLTSLQNNLKTYQSRFADLTDAYNRRGYDENTGLEAKLRAAARAIEATVYDQESLKDMEITLLQVRRAEKDYLSRGGQQYVDEVHVLLGTLEDLLHATSLSPLAQEQLRKQILAYRSAFDLIVKVDRQAGDAEAEVILAARAMEPIAGKIETLGETLATQKTVEAQNIASQTFAGAIITAFFALLATIALALLIANQMTRPLAQLTQAAAQIAAGDFSVRAESEANDEVGLLARTFNEMTERLGQSFEEVHRRSVAVQTSAEVSRRLSAATGARQLALEVVQQLQAAFGYYYAHIYFYDEQRENLLMTGGTGDAGAAMLASGHSIPRGRGLVGRAAETNQPVLVSDVSQTIGWLPNPLLPDTRAEAAVPIAIGGQVLGVIDVQQNRVNGLDATDVDLLQSIAAQVAITLQNVRTYEQSRARAEVESLTNLIGQKIQRASTPQEALQTTLRELASAFAAPRASAVLEAQTQPRPAADESL